LDSVVCCAYSVEAMFHCPYLLHKFVINFLFDHYSVSTALLEYPDLLQGVAVPLPSGLQHLYDCDYEIYNIVVQPYYCYSYCIETIALCTPFTYLLSEKKTLRYQLCSTRYAAVRINNCLKRTFVIKVATMDDLMEAIMCLSLNRHFS